jgi:hypothetical protein
MNAGPREVLLVWLGDSDRHDVSDTRFHQEISGGYLVAMFNLWKAENDS